MDSANSPESHKTWLSSMIWVRVHGCRSPTRKRQPDRPLSLPTPDLLQWHWQMRTGLRSLFGSGFCCWVRTEERRYFHDVSSHRSRGRAKCQARFAQLLSTVCCCMPAGSCRFGGKLKKRGCRPVEEVRLGWCLVWNQTSFSLFLFRTEHSQSN